MFNINHDRPASRKQVFTAVGAACLMLCCSIAFAAEEKPDPAGADTAYVDSVTSWGTWELGIEPAAGPQATAHRALTVRSANIQFRPNDNATYQTGGIMQTTNMPLPGIPPAPIPAIPPGTAQAQPGEAPPGGDPRNR